MAIPLDRKRTNGVIVTRFIVGYKKEESDALLKFLYDHIALSQDIQTRVRWRAGTVVVWDVSYPPDLICWFTIY
jgi:hypothetical protein